MVFSRYGCGNRPHQPGDVDSCSCFENGYESGKEKAYMEIEKWRPGDHHPDCGCQPCKAARTIVTHVLGPKAWG